MTSSDRAAVPGYVTVSGMRRLSLSSISLLQQSNNAYLPVALDGAPDPQNRIDLVKFLFIHAAPVEDVLTVCLADQQKPGVLTAAALKWGMDITPDSAAVMMRDFNGDCEDIKNVSTSILPDGKPVSSKNAPGHQR